MAANLEIVFCHGWGYTPLFWLPLQDRLCHFLMSQRQRNCATSGPSSCKVYHIDLGYTGRATRNELQENSPFEHLSYYLPRCFSMPEKTGLRLAIGHSFGVRHLLSMHANWAIDAVISLCGFWRFPNTSMARHMYKNFVVNPWATMQAFQQKIGLNGDLGPDWACDLLQKDLLAMTGQQDASNTCLAWPELYLVAIFGGIDGIVIPHQFGQNYEAIIADQGHLLGHAGLEVPALWAAISRSRVYMANIRVSSR